MGGIPSFGLLFNDFLLSLGQETSAVAIITGFFFCSISFTGLFTHSLFKKFQIRNVGLFGAGMYVMGSFLTIFATSVEQVVVFYGVLQGMRHFCV